MFQIFVFLCAAVISVPIAKKLGLGSVLGYLIAGAFIGPFAFALVGDQLDDVMHIGEFGVVMMLFLVGLELHPKLLWKMRTSIIGLGGLQLLLTTLVIFLIAVSFDLAWQTSLVVGLVLSLSSTAIVLQTLEEKAVLKTNVGQSAFSVLLFQDIAVIPILAILPLLVIAPAIDIADEQGLSGALQALLILTVMVAIILAGRYLIRPLFRIIASTKLREIFTATALMLVVGISLLMESIGLSAALGAFLAGVVLANSEYRHQLEVEIQPFKGMLLGLFFISVGASIDFDLIMSSPMKILVIATLLVLVKFSILIFIARAFGLRGSSSLMFSFSLAQGSEFAFVILRFATQNNVLTTELVDPIIVAVIISMALTPLLMVLNDRLMKKDTIDKIKDDKRPYSDDMESNGAKVILAGYGRFGQILERMLKLNNVDMTILEYDPLQVDLVRKYGNKIYYGDASRMEMLGAAGADDAKLLIIGIDDHEKSKEIMETARRYYPHLKIFSRAHGRREAIELYRADADYVIRDIFGSSLLAGREALVELGVSERKAMRTMMVFREYDEKRLKQTVIEDDEDDMLGLAISQQYHADLAKVMEDDLAELDKQDAQKSASDSIPS
ncbi:MAG: cation:proton antiporter [Rhizobiales bacterium]|nr:cation:proton antiporter [Hyphomicrobiales bacterium]